MRSRGGVVMRGEVAIVDGEQLQLPGVHGDDIERLAALVSLQLSAISFSLTADS